MINRTDYSGDELTSHLVNLLKRRGRCFITLKGEYYARLIKEQHCKIMLNDQLAHTLEKNGMITEPKRVL
jgi:hypothetical protein